MKLMVEYMKIMRMMGEYEDDGCVYEDFEDDR
jgi:hypothetical protein